MHRFHHVEELIDVDLLMLEFLNEAIEINENRSKKNVLFTLDFVPESFL